MQTEDRKLSLLNLIMLIFLSEATVFFWPLIGIFVNAFILTSLLISAVFDKTLRNLLVCLSIIPAFRLIGFSNPSTDIVFRTLLIYYLIFVMSFVYKVYFKIKKTGHNLNHIKNLYLMVFIGILFGLSEYFYLPKDGLNLNLPLGLALLFFSFFGYTEELLFRGLIQNSLAKITKPLYSVLFTSTLYSFVHLANGLRGIVFAFFVSLIISTIFSQKKNIFLTTILNTTVNLTSFFLVFG